MKKYRMKSLGYPRTPANGMVLHVTFSNGESWDIDAQVIADSRDSHYAAEKEDTIGFIKDGRLDPYDLLDWASNNMNWVDLKAFATKFAEPDGLDYEDEWPNANKLVRKIG